MHDPLICSFTKPIQEFYKGFSELEIVQRAIRDEFGDRAGAIIEAMRKEQPMGDQEDQTRYLIYDLIKVASDKADTISAMGEFEFAININRFGNAYWVSATEFDDAGLFATIEDAKSFAYRYFDSFIEAMDESEKE